VSADLQRRTVRVLVASQMLGGVGVGAGIAVVGLLAYDLAGTEALSGVPATASTVGAAAAAFVIARLTAAHGRRPALVRGYLVGALGAAVAVGAAVLAAFLLHVLASFAFGWASAANLQARYAATDLAEPHHRARALSTVVWATTIGAVLGPNLTGPGGEVAVALGLPPLAGPYVFSVAAFLLAAVVQTVGLRPDPLLAAGGSTGGAPRTPSVRSAARVVRARPEALAAVAAIAAAHATMVGVMVMAPVHLEHHGAALQLVGLTISLHIAGMYALSPLMGWASDRWGATAVVGAGFGQLAAAALLAALAAPVGGGAFQLGLVLLGTGWSSCLVAGSALLTDAVPAEERPGVQGASDLAMNLAGGVGGVLAGIVLALAGFPALAMGTLALLVVPATLLVRVHRAGAGSDGVTTVPPTGPAGMVVGHDVDPPGEGSGTPAP
jgi:MFS family permease